MIELVITEEMKKVMVDAARDAYPEEACGIIAGGICYRLPNRSESPTTTFRLLAADIAGAASDHGGYAGVWHSHPTGNPLPSQADWAAHPADKALLVVAGTSVNVYYGDDSEAT